MSTVESVPPTASPASAPPGEYENILPQDETSSSNKPQPEDLALPKSPPPNISRSNAHDQHQSSLFRLPAEIRLMIYHHLLVYPYSEIRIQDVKERQEEPPQERPLCTLDILASCRRVYDETVDIFYSENLFEVSADKDDSSSSWRDRWLLSTSDDRLEAIRKMRLEKCDPDIALECLEEMQPRLTALEGLIVQRERAHFLRKVTTSKSAIGSLQRMFQERLLAFSTLKALRMRWVDHNHWLPRRAERQNADFAKSDRTLRRMVHHRHCSRCRDKRLAKLENLAKAREDDNKAGEGTGTGDAQC